MATTLFLYAAICETHIATDQPISMMPYRSTSLMRKRSPPLDHDKALGTGPPRVLGGRVFEVPLYQATTTQQPSEVPLYQATTTLFLYVAIYEIHTATHQQTTMLPGRITSLIRK